MATAVPEAGPATRKLDRSIVEGPITRAVWKMAWPTVLQNAIGGLQGIIDHAMVGHFVGFTGNAAIGVSWQIFLVVIVFIASLFTGMGVLVARFAGANQPDKVMLTLTSCHPRYSAKQRIIVTPIKHAEFQGLRITPNLYTTLGEIDTFVGAIGDVLKHGVS